MVQAATPLDDEPSLAQATVCRMRDLLIAGEIRPGERLPEMQLASKLSVSRNTLREAFRLLDGQGLVRHIPNRGVYVAAPDAATVIDIFRTRAALQMRAVEVANRAHPGVVQMRILADMAKTAADASDWKKVGELNLAFHQAMTSICDSSRIDNVFSLLMAELRLAFGQVEDTAYLHQPFVERKLAITKSLEDGENETARQILQEYLFLSERNLLAVLQRQKPQ